MKKNNPFKVPDNYFEDFNRDILLKVGSIEPKNNRKKKSLLSYTKWLSAAAIVTAVAFIGYYSFQKNTDISRAAEIAVNVNNSQEVVNSEKQLASIQNDYYLFIEDETMQQMYKDYIDFENL